MKYFIDTNICIYFLKGSSNNLQKKFLELIPNDIKIPSIVKAELLYGAEKSAKKKENRKLITNFLFPFEIVSFESNTADSYAKIRYQLEKKGEIIGPNDLIITSIALANEGTLVTNNLKEFKRVKGLRVENWL